MPSPPETAVTIYKHYWAVYSGRKIRLRRQSSPKIERDYIGIWLKRHVFRFSIAS